MTLLSQAETQQTAMTDQLQQIAPVATADPTPVMQETQDLYSDVQTDAAAAVSAPVGMADPSPDPVPPIAPPPEAGPIDDQPPPTGTVPAGEPSLQDLYPTAPETKTPVAVGAEGTEADPSVANIDLTPEQQVDAELARILGKDSPLLAQARATAAQMANQRGLMNSSMAAGMTQGEMVKAALPMAQQNAAQAAQRVQLEAQLQTAIEQGNQDAYNSAATQLAELDFAASQQESAERQAYNQQVMAGVTALNEQYLQGTQALDIQEMAGQYQLLISTNETAGGFFNSGLDAIAAVMANPDMTSDQILSAVDVIGKQIQAGLDMRGEINTMDFGEIDFAGGPSAPPAGPPVPTYPDIAG